jgi:hypothetical protein
MTVGVSRGLSRGQADIVTELELQQSVLVSLEDLRQLARRRGVATPERERARGWLLPTGRPGIYEFAPGAHAGPYGHGDPFIELRAELYVDQRLPARLALVSALWVHGLADRAPDRHEVSLPPRVAVPAPLRRAFRVVRFDPRADPQDVDGLPVSSAATLLAHLAARPADVRSWTLVGQALPDLVERSTIQDLDTELAERPACRATSYSLVIAIRTRSIAMATSMPFSRAGVTGQSRGYRRGRRTTVTLPLRSHLTVCRSLAAATRA